MKKGTLAIQKTPLAGPVEDKDPVGQLEDHENKQKGHQERCQYGEVIKIGKIHIYHHLIRIFKLF